MLLLLSSLALALTPRTALPPMPQELPTGAAAASAKGAPSLLVKLKDGQKASAVDGKLSPLVHHDVSALVARAEERSGRAQPDYATLFRVETKGASLQSTSKALATDDAVEVVWASPGLVPPPKGPPGDQDPSESYLKLQRYHLAEHGVGSRDVWKMGFTGKGVRIADVEYGMNLRHEDILATRIEREKGIKPINPFSENHDHGTAVMGIALAQPDKAGIRGIAHGAKGGIYPIYTEQHGLRPADAILKACGDSDAGDIVMLEMQTVSVDGYAPMEVEPDVWMATRTCVDAGVVVIAAAGNGSQNLDGSGFDFWRKRGDSGAIMVGAARGSSGSRAAEDFSNYGKRVDLQGWGSGVFSLGYGDHAMEGGDPNKAYTAVFGGTSSATPIVAGSAALVQEAAKQRTGKPLGPDELRSLLRKTGKKHEGDRRVGELPNITKAIAKLPAAKGKRPGKGGRTAVAAKTSAEEPKASTSSWLAAVGCQTAPPSPAHALWLLGLVFARRRTRR